MNECKNKQITFRESSAAFKGMFCTKYRVFKLHNKYKKKECALHYNTVKFVTLFVKT